MAYTAFTRAEEVTKIGEAITSINTVLANLGKSEALAAEEGAGNVGPEFSTKQQYKSTNSRVIAAVERLKTSKSYLEVAQQAVQ